MVGFVGYCYLYGQGVVLWYNMNMSKNEEILSFVDSNLRLEGMRLSSREKQTIMNCLTGKTNFDDAISRAFAKHRKLTT